MNILLHSINLGETRGEEPCTIHGINSDLFLWATKESIPLIKEAVFVNGVSKNDLTKILANRNSGDKRLDALKIMRSIWEHHTVLGPFPLVDLLRDFENNQVFYGEYRDHLLHQFYVYLLGLYIYSNCDRVNEAVNKEIQDSLSGDSQPLEPTSLTQHFIVRWIATSFMHDVGYVFENEKGDDTKGTRDQETWNKVKDEFNSLLKCPLGKIPGLYKGDIKTLDVSYVEELQNNGNGGNLFYNKSFTTITDFGSPKSSDVLSEIEPEAAKSKLGEKNETPILRRYYQFAAGRDPDETRPRFYDHGISSAIMLLTTHQAHIAQLKQFIENEKELGQSVQNHILILKNQKDELHTFSESIRAAAAAIALHNVNVKMWLKNPKRHKDAFNTARLNENYCLKLEGNDATPLAFLLGLTDTLQNWGRPKFRPRSPDDERKEMMEQDLSIRTVDGRIYFHFVSDAACKKPEHRENSDTEFGKMRKLLSEYLESDVIKDIIKCDEQQENNWRIIDRDEIEFRPVSDSKGSEAKEEKETLKKDISPQSRKIDEIKRQRIRRLLYPTQKREAINKGGSPLEQYLNDDFKEQLESATGWTTLLSLAEWSESLEYLELSTSLCNELEKSTLITFSILEKMNGDISLLDPNLSEEFSSLNRKIKKMMELFEKLPIEALHKEKEGKSLSEHEWLNLERMILFFSLRNQVSQDDSTLIFQKSVEFLLKEKENMEDPASLLAKCAQDNTFGISCRNSIRNLNRTSPLIARTMAIAITKKTNGTRGAMQDGIKKEGILSEIVNDTIDKLPHNSDPHFNIWTDPCREKEEKGLGQ